MRCLPGKGGGNGAEYNGYSKIKLMQNISAIGYGISAVAFLLLTALLVTAWRGKKAGGVLLLCSILSTIWASAAFYQQWNNTPVTAIFVLVELARIFAWVSFLLTITSKVRQDAVGGRFFQHIGALSVVITAIIVVILLYAVFNNGMLPKIIAFDFRITLFIVLTLFGLVLVEQIFRNTPLDARWTIKYLCFGLGAIFAFDFYLYSDALLLKGIDEQVWGARGYVNAMAVPLLAVAIARNPEWSFDVFVSRKFVFHSASIVGAGAYLIIMAAGGYYIKHIGGQWGGALQLIFLFGAVIFLVSLLSSGQLRAQLRVFLSKHFFSYRYDYRDEWLRLTQTLAQIPRESDVNKTIISAITKIVESPGGMLWLRNSSGEYTHVASQRMPGTIECYADENHSLVEFLKNRKWVIELTEVESQQESYPGLVLPEWLLGIEEAWLIIPLITDDSQRGKTNSEAVDDKDTWDLLGFLVLSRPLVHIGVNWEVRDLLLTAGRQCASYLALMKAKEELMDARQFDAFNRLSAYVVHDLKNIVAQLSLIVSNANRHRDNPAFFDDVVLTVENASAKMQRMLTQLRKGRLEAEESRGIVNLDKLLTSVVKQQSAKQPVPVYIANNRQINVLANEDRFSAVLGHLIENAQDATPSDGSVEIELHLDKEWVYVNIKDTGCGMDKEFIRDQLFRPFVTTKGNAGMGIGVYESREFISSIGGQLTVDSKPGKGTCFTLKIPMITKEEVVAADQGNAELKAW